jgi:hypothetical protein
MKTMALLLLALTPDQSHDNLIAKMRESALTYADRLQDFLCTETLVRTLDTTGTQKHWNLLETQELELGYIDHKEHYKLTKVNGKTTKPEKLVKKGYFRPGGEFGSSLRKIFDPEAAAQFEWDREETAAGKRICIFSYRVPLETTTLVLVAGQDHVPLSHQGFVTANCETGEVTRIQIESLPAFVKRNKRDYRVGVQLDVQYAPTQIAGNEYLLPQTAIEIAPFGLTLTRAEIHFDKYRKYDSSVSIKFDDKETPPDTGKL